MSFITDFVGDLTGAGAMQDATDLQREMYTENRELSKEDRAALLTMYGNAEKEGFFDWEKRLGMYDKATDPQNATDVRNVAFANKVAGGRPGETNTDAAVAMVVNAQKKSRGEQAMKFFDQGFRDRFTYRQAIAGNNANLAANAGQNLAGNLNQQGQFQQQQFAGLVGSVTPFLAGKPGGGKPGSNPTGVGGDGSSGVPPAVTPAVALGAQNRADIYQRPQFLDQSMGWLS